MYELFYTSLARGLVPGTSGYTTVGHTNEMARTLVEQAEKLSSYSFLSGDPTAYAREPVSWLHLRLGGGGQGVHVVSRIAACPPDYTGRSNYLAHHVFLAPQEAGACKAGPAALVASPGFLATQWQGEARLLPARTAPAIMDRGATTSAVESAGVDAGWAGALADRLRDRGIKQTFLIYSPNTDIIGIVGDVLSDLSPEERWQATFATHVTKPFLGIDCRLQCVVAGTPYAQDVLKRYPADAFDLAKLPPPPPRVQRQRGAAAATPRPVAAAKPLPAPPGAVVRSSRTETYAEPEPAFDQSVFGSPTFAPPPPSSVGSHGGFGGVLFWGPMVFSALMTVGCGLLGVQWLQARQKLGDLQGQYDSLRNKNDSLEEKLSQAQKKVASLKADLDRRPPSTQQAAGGGKKEVPDASQNGGSGGTAVATKSDAGGGADPRDAETSKTESATKQPGKGDAGESSAAMANTSSERTSTDVSPSSGKSNKSPPSTPRVLADVQSKLDSATAPDKSTSKKTDITIVDNVDACPAGISLDNEKLCDMLEAKIEGGGPKWTVKVKGGKTIADIKYDSKGKTLDFELKASPVGYLSRFLTLRVDVEGSPKPLVIPLGSPLKAELRVELTAQKPEAWPQVCKLFKDDMANALLARLVADMSGKNIYESVEFLPEAGCESFAAESKNVPGSLEKHAPKGDWFAIARKGNNPMVGVVLMRDSKQHGEYSLHSYLINPLQYGPLSSDSTLKGRWFFTPRDCAFVSALMETDLKALTVPDIKAKLPADREAKLKAAQLADTAAIEEAQKFAKEGLIESHYPVRFELRIPGSDEGFVIVDSLPPRGGGK